MLPWILTAIVLASMLVWSMRTTSRALDLNDELLKHSAGLQVRADDLALQNRNLREALARAERTGVIEGLFDLEECGYWKPTKKELAELRKEYPGRFDEDMEDEDAPDNVA